MKQADKQPTSEALVSETLACLNFLFENSENICTALLVKIGKEDAEAKVKNPDAAIKSTLEIMKTATKNLKQLL